jgi:hypothetical protein
MQTREKNLISQRAQDVEDFLNSFDQEILDLVTDMFAHFLTPYEVAAQLNISYSLWTLVRETNIDFNVQVLRWETLAMAKLHEKARKGVESPRNFSSSSYDRVAQVLEVACATQNEPLIDTNDISKSCRGDQQSSMDFQAFLNAHSAPIR